MVSYDPGAPGSGTPIAPERLTLLLDSLLFRRVVEPGAAYLAAARKLRVSERQVLTASLMAVSGATEPAEHRQADCRFHLAVASLSGSTMTIASVTEVQAHLHELLAAIPVLDVNIEHSTAQHRAIAEAVLAGQPARARRAMEQHCDDTAALLRGLVG